MKRSWNYCGLFLIGWLTAFNAAGEVRLLTGDVNNNLHNNDGYLQDLSADGTLVLFNSGPPISGTTPGITQGGLYIRNLVSNTLSFTGATNIGGEGVMSDDGRYVAWTSTANFIYWRDVHSNITRLITPAADGACRKPILSANGRYVAYVSLARNLVTTTNLLPAINRAAVYLYDSQSQTTTVASLTYDGKALSTGVGLNVPQTEFDFSANGQYVFFSTESSNVHPARLSFDPAYQSVYWVYRRNVTNGTVDVVCRNATNAIPIGNFSSPATDATGNRVAFFGSYVGAFGGPLMITNYVANINADLYLKDLTSGEVWWVSKTTNGTTPDANFSVGGTAISGNGKVVAFGSTGAKFVLENTDPPGGATDPWDVFRADIGTNGSRDVTISLVSKTAVGTNNVGVFAGSWVTTNGSYVAFITGTHYPLIGVGDNESLWRHGFGVGTLPVAVAVPPPALKFATAPGQFSLSWPLTAGVNLYFKTNLTDAVWNLVTNTPTLANGTNTVMLTTTYATRFFVLRNP